MDYSKHYIMLIERAQNREIDGYTESHHILPKCLGGKDNKENLVNLTGEEHYLAHQLLTKIYPTHIGLVLAAAMMTCEGKNHKRSKNKLYGWLRRKHSEAMKISQAGKKNSQFGTCWVSNLETKESKKISSNELEMFLQAGWIKKRIINWQELKTCPVCSTKFHKKGKTCSPICGSKIRDDSKRLDRFNDKLPAMLAHYDNGMSIYKALKTEGFCGTGSTNVRLTQIIKNR